MWRLKLTLFLLSLTLCLASSYIHPHGRIRSQRAEEKKDESAALGTKVVSIRDAPKSDEPTCEQLKAMWRFSKRQARAPEIINEMTPYRDPFAMNEWPVYPMNSYPIRSSMPRYMSPYDDGLKASYRSYTPSWTFGHIVHRAPPGRGVSRVQNLDTLYGVLADREWPHTKLPAGTPRSGNSRSHSVVTVPQQGRFQKLKEMIQTERAKELRQQREAEQQAVRAAALKNIAAGDVSETNLLQFGENDQIKINDMEFINPEGITQPRNRIRPSTAGLQFSRYSAYNPPHRRSFYPTMFVQEPDYNDGDDNYFNY